MDAPSGPPETASAPADLLTALPPDLLRRTLEAVEGDVPPDSMEYKSPLTPLLLLCKVLSDGAKASITRVHVDTPKHSLSTLASLSPQLQCLSLRVSGDLNAVERQIQILASHFPNLKKIAISVEGRLSGWRPSVGPLRVLPHLSQLSVGFSPRGGLVFFADSTHGGASASPSFTPEEGLASLATLEELDLWDEHMVILDELPPNLRNLRVGVSSNICATPAPLWLPPSPSSSARLQTAELRNLLLRAATWRAPGFPLSSLTSLTLAEVKELPPLSGLKCLSTLSIKDCPALELGYDAFQGLETLQVLKLQSLPNAGLFPREASLSSLRFLYISDVGFQKLTLALVAFQVLEELVLDRVTVTHDQCGVILCGMTPLRSLRITNSTIRALLLSNQMSQLETVHLERLPALTVVDLDGVSSLKSVYISQLPLTVLSTHNCCQYPALGKLHLEELTQLDAKLIRALQVPPSLRSLTLIALPSELLPSLRGCTRLEELRLRALRPRCAPADAGTHPFVDSNLPPSLQRLEVFDVQISDHVAAS